MTLPDSLSDAALLQRCADRPELFGEFYRRHVDAVLRYLVSRTGDAQVAADLTAETFAAAFASRARYRDTGAPAVAWLFGIARNQLATFARRRRVARKYRRRMGIDDISLDDADQARVEAMADFDALRPAIAAALASLTTETADAIRLRVIENRPYAEVAAELGITEGAARVRVSRGLARIAARLEQS